jgi:hypothetical protein
MTNTESRVSGRSDSGIGALEAVAETVSTTGRRLESIMSDQGRDVIVTNDGGGRSTATIFGALIIAAAIIFGIWYFATQTDANDPTGVTIELDSGGE